MSPLVYIALLVWIPVILFLYKWLPPRRVVIIAFIFSFLFLPQYSFPLPILPDYGRMSSTYYGILLGMILFDIKRFKEYQPSWLDLPILIYCISPFVSSISNDLGIKDGVVASLAEVAVWGVPYFIGRVYFNTLDSLRQLAIGIFIGGLIYVPFCLWEVRMSPQLHMQLYGFRPPGWAQSMRYGGFRPIVFLDHGLQVSLWMVMATLIGIWLWRTGTIKKVFGVPMAWLVTAQVVTVILIKSTGAWILLGLGTVILMTTRWVKIAILVWLLIVLVPTHLYFSTTGSFNSNVVVEFMEKVTNPERAQSLQFRFDMEEALAEKARERYLFGWGGWGRSFLYSEDSGERISVTDSRWIIIFGENGIFGLASFYIALLLPPCIFLIRYSSSVWPHKRLAPAVVLAMVVLIYTLDSLVNDMGSPLYIVANGGIVGLLVEQKLREHGVRLNNSEKYLTYQ